MVIGVLKICFNAIIITPAMPTNKAEVYALSFKSKQVVALDY